MEINTFNRKVIQKITDEKGPSFKKYGKSNIKDFLFDTRLSIKSIRKSSKGCHLVIMEFCCCQHKQHREGWAEFLPKESHSVQLDQQAKALTTKLLELLKRWENNIKEWTGIDFVSSSRSAEDRVRWKVTVLKSSVMPKKLLEIYRLD